MLHLNTVQSDQLRLFCTMVSVSTDVRVGKMSFRKCTNQKTTLNHAACDVLTICSAESLSLLMDSIIQCYLQMTTVKYLGFI